MLSTAAQCGLGHGGYHVDTEGAPMPVWGGRPGKIAQENVLF